MTISLIAAIGKNNELGKDNQLLWNIPEDMKHFRETTRGHTVIMGRKTFESIGKALPNRRNIVITRDANYRKDGVDVTNSLEEAILLCENSEEVFIIGGGEIYKQALPFASKLYITHVHKEYDADTFFPEIKESDWIKTRKDDGLANDVPYSFATYEKKPE